MSDHPRSVMLFAAGLGTRMAPLTDDRPKPLIEVAGRALLDHALDLATDAGVSGKVVNVHYRADQIRTHLSGRTDVAISDETDLLLETGGGLRKALPLLGEGPVFTLNTDAVWAGPNPLLTLLDAWRPDTMDALLLLVPRGNARAHRGGGDFLLDRQGRIEPGPGHVYTGAQIIRTDRLEGIADRAFSMWRLWDRLLAEGRMSGVLHPGDWCDVGHPHAIAEAEAMLSGTAR